MNKDEPKKGYSFYENVLKIFLKSKIPFLVGGAFALKEYTGVNRKIKDLDLFCKASDYPKLVEIMTNLGYKVEHTDSRWIAKAYHKKMIVDIIFNSANSICPVTDTWFEHAPKSNILGINVRLMPPEEIIWTKIFIAERDRFDGADINHLILKKGKEFDWKRLFNYVEPYWEVFLSHLIFFIFVYPSERNIIPKWILDELLRRLQDQLNLPVSIEKVCRGRVLSRHQYEIDIKLWGYETEV